MKPYRILVVKSFLMMLFVQIALQANAQKEGKVAFNGYKGNYIYNLFKPASAEHPDGDVIAFRLDRKAQNESNWQELYKFSTPSNYEELKNNYQAAKNKVFEYNPTTAYTADEVWPIFKKKFNYDSLSVYLTQQPLAIAFNILLVDTTAKHNAVYQYRVIQLKRDGTEQHKYTSSPVSANDFFITNKPKRTYRKTTGDVFRIEWRAKATAELPEVLLVKRSDGVKMPFNRILTTYNIEHRGDSIIYTVEDNQVSKDVLYQYSISPVNRFGGGAKIVSDTLQVASLDQQMLIPKIFTATADSTNNSIKLNWAFIKPDYVSVVNVYRSTEYESGYKLLASTAGYSYIDKTVIPGQKYYYYLVVVDKLGRATERGIKIYGLVHQIKPSDPPANVVVKNVNKHHVISWTDYNNDTRGYYVYRTNEVGGDMKPITEMIYFDAKAKRNYVYIDTADNLSPTVGYALVTENLSNTRSVFSKIFYLSNPNFSIAAPVIVDFKKDGKGIYLFWQDTTVVKQVSGYNIYRKSGNSPYVKVNKTPVLGFKNTFKDEFLFNDVEVSYKITGVTSTDKESGFSNEITVSSNQLVYAPSALKSFTGKDNKSIILQWQPSQSEVAKYELYRYVRGADPTKIADIDAKILTHTDATYDKGKINYYFIKTIGVNGKTSLPSAETYVGNR
ncbi:hypothetical protein EZ456_13495 [Pedobacter psychrodurus]|uniref:Fibronectin type 3 domain-containing protein n=1 Tax=Pedobacter psychrodurus TaxID=2530456 RepID=A0A4V6N6J4_9SPHI|nr:hypothetical protein [Pedobacter psychrodurus]TCD26308.1 hypothetical protein EZ456_13495 [Pedobacter psychrodurus]